MFAKVLNSGNLNSYFREEKEMCWKELAWKGSIGCNSSVAEDSEVPQPGKSASGNGSESHLLQQAVPQTSDNENWEQIILSEIWALSGAKTIKKWLDHISH